MNIGIIIQARTGSSRLPQKMVLPFYENKGILETIIIRLIEAGIKIPIVIATTTCDIDDIIADIGFKYKLPVFRGSEENVLERFILTANEFGFNKIIRICADNPFLDISALNYQIESFIEMDVDYWCYALGDYTPSIKTHYGFWTEGVKLSTLKKIASSTKENVYQEHVTNYIYSNSNHFSIHYEKIEKTIENEHCIRLTIDTKVDFSLGQRVFRELNELKLPLTATNILKHIKGKAEIINIMRNEIAKNTK